MNKKANPIGYKISKITTKEFFYKNDLQDLINDINDIYDFTLKSNLTIIDQDSFIVIEYEIHLVHKLMKQEFIKFICSTKYKIENFNAVYNAESKQYDIPTGLLIQIYAIAYSHARALLWSELNKTDFKDKLYLPVVDPQIFIQK